MAVKVNVFKHPNGDVLHSTEDKLEPLACQFRKRAKFASKAKQDGKKVNEKHLSCPPWVNEPGAYVKVGSKDVPEADVEKLTEEGGEELPALTPSDAHN